MPKLRYRRRTPEEIQQILSDLSDSGQSQLNFASQREIPYSTLQSWIKKNRNPKLSGHLPAIIPVGPFPSRTPAIEIELPHGEIIRLEAGVSGTDLETILRALKRC
jgi:hypothetical protein